MTPRPTPLLAAALLLALAACDDRGGPRAGPPADTPAPPPAAPPAEAPAWRSSPSAGIAVRPEPGGVLVETGPHVVLWPADGRELAPPYTVRATLEKRAGRLHEGVGLIFGASALEEPESGQTYSYFLVRGDGSYLVKRRRGAETPVVRDWTRHPAIQRDDEEQRGRPNQLEVRVTEAEVAFLVNGALMERVPAGALDLRGRAGVRAAHDVQLAVTGFTVDPAVPDSVP